MDAGDRDELRALRARAYGPAADIHEDPAALRRLQELEPRLSAEPPPSHTEPHDGDVASAPQESVPQQSGHTPPGEDDSARGVDSVVSPAKAPRRRWIGVGVLWLLSVIVAAGVAWAVTSTTTYVPPVAATRTERQVATLEPSSIRTLPKEWFGTSSNSLVFDFHGLTVFTSDSGLGTGTNCFMIVPTSEVPDEEADAGSWSDVGILLTGCKAGGFPATAQATVGEAFPEELRTVFPPGSALKFVLEGERVRVFSSAG